jgi:hypothetical protein
MWKLFILTGAILFFGAQPVKAQHVDVHVGTGGGGHHGRGPGPRGPGPNARGHYYRGGHPHAFVYRTYWHHRRWQHVWLDPSFTVYLGPQPYAGPGYQIVNVYFADGSVLNNVYVYNQDQIELPPAFAGRQIVRLVVVGGG